MALDESLQDALKETYFKIKTHLESTQLTREHSNMIIKHEALGELVQDFDAEVLEEQTKDIHGLHAQLDAIKAICEQIDSDLETITDTAALATKVAEDLDAIFTKINNIVL